jgi:hypothetical protein
MSSQAVRTAEGPGLEVRVKRGVALRPSKEQVSSKCPHYSEATTAIRAELTVRELDHTIHAHPTFSDAWMETAHAVRGEAIHAPPKRKK